MLSVIFSFFSNVVLMRFNEEKKRDTVFSSLLSHSLSISPFFVQRGTKELENFCKFSEKLFENWTVTQLCVVWLKEKKVSLLEDE